MEIEIYDIECLGGMFLYCGYNPRTKEWKEFEISEWKNDIFALVKHLEFLCRESFYGVSYNGLSYDAQVLQFIVDNYVRWIDYDNKRIIKIIKKFSNRVIDDLNYDLFPPYREEELDVQQIDLLRVHHYDNENMRTSLKWLEFSMDFYNVEEMPFPHTHEDFTEDQLKEVRAYCRNDVEATHELWKYTLGEVDHKEYKGRNMIKDRLNIMEEVGFSSKTLSWNNVKIGDEINKRIYRHITGISEKRLYEIKKERGPTPRFTYGDCIPSYVVFRTERFRDFHNRMKGVKVNITKKEEYPFRPYGESGITFMIAKGGIHSNERNRLIIPKEDEVLIDADIGSQYPNAIIKRKLSPSHLGNAWLVGYTSLRNRRLEYKAAIKTCSTEVEKRKLEGLSEDYKLALNGGGFGKTNEVNSWQYDPFVHFSCTIGNQFEILMLIEDLLIEGINTVSANTDGIVCLFKKDQINTYYNVCRKWEEKVGNSKHGKLEYSQYKKLAQLSVNGYLAIKENGSIKKKKDFLTDTLLHKNKSRRIVAIALEEYFVNGKEPEDTIRNHQNIFDFCIGIKASKKYHYEGVQTDGTTSVYDRMIRYYVSEKGEKLLKIKNPDVEADGNDVSQCEAGNWRCTVANKIDKDKPISEYGINYNYYINKAKTKIDAIETGGRRKGPAPDPNQGSLF